MQHLLRALLNFIIPQHEEVRVAEAVSLEALRDKMVLRKGAFPWITAAFPYRDPTIRALIKANKFYGNRHAAHILGVCLTDVLLSVLEEELLLEETVLIIPIPASPQRKRARGYNQVERMLLTQRKTLAYLGTYCPDVLKRIDRKSQVHVERKSRTKNIARAFYVPDAQKASLQGAYCVLVDDVSETGTTLNDAKRALLEAGAREVFAVVVAR